MHNNNQSSLTDRSPMASEIFYLRPTSKFEVFLNKKKWLAGKKLTIHCCGLLFRLVRRCIWDRSVWQLDVLLWTCDRKSNDVSGNGKFTAVTGFEMCPVACASWSPRLRLLACLRCVCVRLKWLSQLCSWFWEVVVLHCYWHTATNNMVDVGIGDIQASAGVGVTPGSSCKAFRVGRSCLN